MGGGEQVGSGIRRSEITGAGWCLAGSQGPSPWDFEASSEGDSIHGMEIELYLDQTFYLSVR